MKGLRTFGAMAAISALFVGVAAQASAAHLDRELGSGGVRILPSSLGESTGAALLGDGRVIVGGRNGLTALLPSGEVDTSFGDGGYAPFGGPSGGSVGIATVAVDPKGRPIAVGSFARQAAGGSVQAPLLGRWTAAGRPDPEFGEGGYLVGDFGLPAPAGGEGPDAFLNDVGFDSAGRIFAVGMSRIGSTPAKYGEADLNEVFVTRVDDSGRLDPHFGSGGVFRLPTTRSINGGWGVGPEGTVAVIAARSRNRADSILRLGADGKPAGRFGTHGYVPLPPGVTYSPLLVEPGGAMISFGYLSGVEHRLPNGILIRRLRPNGTLDRDFGKGGAAKLRIPRLYTGELALDERGRILIAVSLKQRGPIGEPHDFALVRLRADGRLDRSFGHEGMVRVPFAGQPWVYPEGFDVRGDQALISASYCGGGGCRPLLALVDLGG